MRFGWIENRTELRREKRNQKERELVSVNQEA